MVHWAIGQVFWGHTSIYSYLSIVSYRLHAVHSLFRGPITRHNVVVSSVDNILQVIYDVMLTSYLPITACPRIGYELIALTCSAGCIAGALSRMPVDVVARR